MSIRSVRVAAKTWKKAGFSDVCPHTSSGVVTRRAGIYLERKQPHSGHHSGWHAWSAVGIRVGNELGLTLFLSFESCMKTSFQENHLNFSII